VAAPHGPRPIDIALLSSVFVVAACGLLYELAAGALASYLLGDSVLQFSTIIGTYLFAMGVGSWLSRYFERQLPAHFLRIELLVALIGGTLPAVLFLANAYAPGAFRFLLYGMVLVVGTLVGLEIPLVMRILKRNVALKDLVSQVLTFDYLGALAVSLAFPLLLVPQLGLIRTGLLFGLLNALVACGPCGCFAGSCGAWARMLRPVLHGAWPAAGGAVGGRAHHHLCRRQVLPGPHRVYTAASPYQRIVVTHGKLGHRLFLNGNLQFAERDEYRYHEALVHPAMAAHGAPKRVAVLGGGDGMAVREILKYPSVESVTLVELDPAMTRLFHRQPHAGAAQWRGAAQPQGAHRQHRCSGSSGCSSGSVGAQDFDVIVVDFPDPTNFAIGKLYTNSFYALLDRRLAASGYAVCRPPRPWWHARVSGPWCHHRIGGPDGGALPRPCAQLWRMGLCAGQPPALAHARALPPGCSFLERQHAAAAV
jgi:spermidine synthase